MIEEINLLLEKFKEISNKDWIKSISDSYGSIGLTFEKELGKNLIHCISQTIKV